MTDFVIPDEDLVTVCAACLTASCWLGLSPCADEIGEGVTRTVAELDALGLEHPSNYRPAEADAA